MKGVSSGSGGRANRVTSDNEGRKLVSFGFLVFSGTVYFHVHKTTLKIQNSPQKIGGRLILPL